MNAGRQQESPDRVDEFAAPKLVGVAGRHADHEEKWCNKPTTHQTVMASGAVEVEGARDWHDRFEVRRPLDGGFYLRPGEIGDSDHADVSVGPWLDGRPLDKVVHVAAFLAVEEAERSPSRCVPRQLAITCT